MFQKAQKNKEDSGQKPKDIMLLYQVKHDVECTIAVALPLRQGCFILCIVLFWFSASKGSIGGLQLKLLRYKL